MLIKKISANIDNKIRIILNLENICTEKLAKKEKIFFLSMSGEKTIL